MSDKKMRTVAIESPYAGDVFVNSIYLDTCIRDCISRGETPYASHKMLTTALDDNNPEQRKIGIEVGIAMSVVLDMRVFYVDLGWSDGMKKAKEYYENNNISYEIRKIENE